MVNLTSELNESSLPILTYKRSRHFYKKNYKTTLNAGMLIPIYANELVQPGDTFKIDLSFVAREITPYKPVMDNMDIQFFAFAVDWLDIWNDTKAFWGENTLGAWAQQTEYYTPQIKIPKETKITAHSLLAYLGFPQKSFEEDSTFGGGLSVNTYCLIYNEWMRNQNYIAPLAINMAGTTITYDPTDVTKGGLVCNTMKYHDRFTAGVPSPERGEPIPMPVYEEGSLKVKGNGMTLGLTDGTTEGGLYTVDPYGVLLGTNNNGTNVGTANTGLAIRNGKTIGITTNADESGMVVDVLGAVSAALSAQRLAVATNHILEKLAMYGGRYREIIKACWGVSSSDLSQHIPEYLGGWRQPLNMEEVIATTAATNQNLGENGAMSLTNGYGNLLTKSFNQHAVIMILATIRHDQTYGQGLPAQYFKSRKYDYYWNDFAGISFQPVLNGEIFVQGTDEDKEAFAFLPPWSEYKSEVNQITGMFNPYYSSNGTAEDWLKEWTYANNFENLPAMGQDFLEQTPENVDRTVVVQSEAGDQFLMDCEFVITKWSEVPDFRIVGLDRF